MEKTESEFLVNKALNKLADSSNQIGNYTDTAINRLVAHAQVYAILALVMTIKESQPPPAEGWTK